MKKVIYLCNPDSNKACTKEGCFLNNGPCYSTLDRDCAVFAEGYPIINNELDVPDDFEQLNMNLREANNHD